MVKVALILNFLKSCNIHPTFSCGRFGLKNTCVSFARTVRWHRSMIVWCIAFPTMSKKPFSFMVKCNAQEPKKNSLLPSFCPKTGRILREFLLLFFLHIFFLYHYISKEKSKVKTSDMMKDLYTNKWILTSIHELNMKLFSPATNCIKFLNLRI